MNEGEIDQIGTPFEIYNFPKTKFVAGFVGTLNTAMVKVVNPEKGLLSMDGIELKTSSLTAGKVEGDEVRIAIRPERFSFLVEGKKDNIVDCRIENITFLGSVVRIQLLIGKSKFNMDTFNRPSLELPKIGDIQQVTCSRKAVLVLND
jgi:putative spermidine/putrescine transport system ATP-binding protein